MLKINISKDASRFLKKLTPKHGKQVAQKIMDLRENPKPNDSQWLKGYPYMRADIHSSTHNQHHILLLNKTHSIKMPCWLFLLLS